MFLSSELLHIFAKVEIKSYQDSSLKEFAKPPAVDRKPCVYLYREAWGYWLG